MWSRDSFPQKCDRMVPSHSNVIAWFLPTESQKSKNWEKART
jgi:hypothetical protein